MLIAVLAALALLYGVHPGALLIAAVAYARPTWFLAAATGWALYHGHRRRRARRDLPAVEMAFLQALASEVEAGASLRHGLATAAAAAPDLGLSGDAQLAVAGRPPSEIAARLVAALPVNGRTVGAAFSLVATTGARAAVVFAALAARAADAVELERERRTLTAQAQFSAVVVGGLPTVVTAGLLLAGRGPGGDRLGGVLAAAGMGLVALGGLVIWLMVRDR
ncbi:MAG: hypothetical protein HKN74_01310 [Acidimicrobiia bacterium]|nr:hypothetical protein [Acidimicrobiia bacterium]NNL71246.1 hypothetical protein [Acidimicrobiia bacterium]